METKNEQKQETGLPPAGDARREELKRRTDTLEERAAVQFADVEKIDPAKMKPDNEILSQIWENPNLLGVTNQQPGRKYKWVYVGQNGYFVTQARLQGWIQVQGDDPEAEEKKWVDSTRKLGDTILFWMPEERYKKLQQVDFERRMIQQNSLPTQDIEEAGKQNGIQVVRGIKNANVLRKLEEQAFARHMAEQKFKQMIQSGKIPGMEIEG